MSNTHKILVLAFLKNLPENPSEQFNKAFELYKLSPNKNRAAESSYNRKGYTDQSLKNLLYDLQKINDITDVEILSIQETKTDNDKVVLVVGKISEAFEKLSDESKKAILEAAIFLTKFEDFIEKSDDLKEKVALGTSTFETFKKENIDLIFEENKDYSMFDALNAKLEENPLFIEQFNIDIDGQSGNTFSKESTHTEVDEEAEKTLREEFPFLNNDDCPQILYVVVGKRIAAYNKHKELHAKLDEINTDKTQVTPEELKTITAECDDAFSDNRALWDELNHYASTGEILGKHPIFREDNIKKEVDGMSNEDMFKFIKNSPKYFCDQKAALEKHKGKAEKIAEIESRIADRKYKLVLVQAKAGVNAGDKK